VKAIVQDRYGQTEVLAFEDIERPVVGKDDVLVHVRAAAVDAGTVHLMTGRPLLMRVIGLGLRRPKVRVRGMDLAGVVEAVGANVTRFAPGDEVFGVADGSFAEYAVAPASRLVPKPANVTFEQAAAVAISGLTAMHALRAGEVRAGQSVLVIGAAGGVGTFTVQLAKAAGAEVTGVCSTTKLDVVRALGATAVDYTRAHFAGGRRYDLIVDIAGNRPLSVLRRALTPKGTLVLVGGEGGPVLDGLERLLRAFLLNLVVGQRLRSIISVTRQPDLVELAGHLAAGTVAPVIDRTFALVEAPGAIRHVAGGHARGKVVVNVSEQR